MFHLSNKQMIADFVANFDVVARNILRLLLISWILKIAWRVYYRDVNRDNVITVFFRGWDIFLPDFTMLWIFLSLVGIFSVIALFIGLIDSAYQRSKRNKQRDIP